MLEQLDLPRTAKNLCPLEENYSVDTPHRRLTAYLVYFTPSASAIISSTVTLSPEAYKTIQSPAEIENNIG